MNAQAVVEVSVQFDKIIEAIKSGTIYCKDNFALVGDSFITYKVTEGGEFVSISEETPKPTIPVPPTITIQPDTIVDFVIDTNEAPNQLVYFEWFHDPALKALRLGVASNATRYQALPHAQIPVDVTMTIVTQFEVIDGKSEEFTIGWDPILQVEDP